MKEQVKDTHIYLPVKLLRQLKEVAQGNRRTMTAEIAIAVEKHVADANGTRSKTEGRQR